MGHVWATVSGYFRVRSAWGKLYGMTPTATLNAARLGQWLTVVNRQGWKTHTLHLFSGEVEETVCAPLIVWAAKPGEGEALPRVRAPEPSPLVAQLAVMNKRAHFLAFVRAAHGKVRHSVRWKTGARVRRLWKLQALDRARCVLSRLRRQERACRGQNLTRRALRTPSKHWNGEHVYAIECLEERFEHLTSTWASQENSNDVDRSLLEFLDAELSAVYMGYTGPQMWASGPERDRYLPYLLAYARAIGDKWGLVEVVAAMRYRPYSLAGLLKHLERAAYRAHLTRRVRPVSRRTRAPRPLYVRPRPPTAPLAPPVA